MLMAEKKEAPPLEIPDIPIQDMDPILLRKLWKDPRTREAMKKKANEDSKYDLPVEG
jgi:hypothetical protein